MKKSPSVKYGFSLIEVMIAFALMALGIIKLVQAQVEYTRTATEGKYVIIASQLARMKLIDCKYNLIKDAPGASDWEDHGDFSSESDGGFPEFRWECHAPALDIPPPNMELIGKATKSDGDQSPNIMTQILGMIYPLLVPAISNSVRELVTIIRWKLGTKEQELKIVTHVANQAQFAQAMSAFPNLGQVLGGKTPGGTPP